MSATAVTKSDLRADLPSDKAKGKPVHPLKPAAVPLPGAVERPCRVFVDDFALLEHGSDAGAGHLPRSGSALVLQHWAGRWTQAIQEGKSAAIAFHHDALRAGATPFLIDGMRRGWIQAIMLTGQAALMDAELAMVGKTDPIISPQAHDVPARETAHAFAMATRMGQQRQMGLAQALAGYLDDIEAPFVENSLVVQATRLGRFVSIHPSIGQEEICLSDHLCGAALGESSLWDFRRLAGWTQSAQDGLLISVGPTDPLVGIFQNACRLAGQHGRKPAFSNFLAVGTHASARAGEHFSLGVSDQFHDGSLPGPCELVLPLLHRMMQSASEEWSRLPAAPGLENSPVENQTSDNQDWRQAS